MLVGNLCQLFAVGLCQQTVVLFFVIVVKVQIAGGTVEVGDLCVSDQLF